MTKADEIVSMERNGKGPRESDLSGPDLFVFLVATSESPSPGRGRRNGPISSWIGTTQALQFLDRLGGILYKEGRIIGSARELLYSTGGSGGNIYESMQDDGWEADKMRGGVRCGGLCLVSCQPPLSTLYPYIPPGYSHPLSY